MREPRPRLDELFPLLAAVEELDELRLSLTGAAVPDPEKEWAKSAAASTVDRRVVGRAEVERALADAEAAVQARVARVFGLYRAALGALLDGREEEGVAQLLKLGEAEEREGRPDRARRFFEVALARSLPFPDKGLQVLALRRTARVLRTLGELNEALRYYGRSAELARDAEDARAEIIARIGSGTVLGYQGRWAQAEAVFLEALARIEALPARPALELGQVYNNLAAMTTRQDRFAEAEEWFRLALDHWGRAETGTDLAVCYFNLAVLRKRQGRRDESRAMYHKALSLDIPAASRAVFAIDLAQLYAEDGHPGRAREWAQEAERQAIAARSPYALGHMYLGLGNMARAGGDEAGFVYYEKALEIARGSSLALLEGQVLLGYALLRRATDQAEEAVAYLERAAELFEAMGALHELEQARSALDEARPPAGRVPLD